MLKIHRFYKAIFNCSKCLTARRLTNQYKYLRDVSINTENIKLSTVQRFDRKCLRTGLALSILSWLGFTSGDEEKESELIMTLKRAVLASNREQYDKAEQLLHLALRLAQQQQNEQGITYCYDLMANVAFDNHQLNKAEKLFVSVLQRLLSTGTKQDDLKVIHISLKLARICHLRAEQEKADMGYNWCLDQIQKQKDSEHNARMLYGVIQDWYAQFLLDNGEYGKSLKHLKEAYAICKELKGQESEQSMLLLNDLGTTTWRAGDIEGAQSLLSQAIQIGQNLEDKTHLGVVHANLGLLYLEKGILEEARKYCKEAWNLGKRHENTESVMQADYCFEQIKMNIGK